MAGFTFFALVNIALLLRYGARNAIGFMATFTFLCGTAIILFLTWQATIGIDWMTPIPLISIPMLSA